jgi:hypothetical protein
MAEKESKSQKNDVYQAWLRADSDTTMESGRRQQPTKAAASSKEEKSK